MSARSSHGTYNLGPKPAEDEMLKGIWDTLTFEKWERGLARELLAHALIEFLSDPNPKEPKETDYALVSQYKRDLEAFKAAQDAAFTIIERRISDPSIARDRIQHLIPTDIRQRAGNAAALIHKELESYFKGKSKAGAFLFMQQLIAPATEEDNSKSVTMNIRAFQKLLDEADKYFPGLVLTDAFKCCFVFAKTYSMPKNNDIMEKHVSKNIVSASNQDNVEELTITNQVALLENYLKAEHMKSHHSSTHITTTSTFISIPNSEQKCSMHPSAGHTNGECRTQIRASSPAKSPSAMDPQHNYYQPQPNYQQRRSEVSREYNFRGRGTSVGFHRGGRFNRASRNPDMRERSTGIENYAHQNSSLKAHSHFTEGEVEDGGDYDDDENDDERYLQPSEYYQNHQLYHAKPLVTFSDDPVVSPQTNLLGSRYNSYMYDVANNGQGENRMGKRSISRSDSPPRKYNFSSSTGDFNYDSNDEGVSEKIKSFFGMHQVVENVDSKDAQTSNGLGDRRNRKTLSNISCLMMHRPISPLTPPIPSIRITTSAFRKAAPAPLHCADGDRSYLRVQLYDAEASGDFARARSVRQQLGPDLNPARKERILDNGASDNIINDTFRYLPNSFVPARGSIFGSDPNSTPGQIIGKVLIEFKERVYKAYYAPTIPKSVIAMNATSMTDAYGKPTGLSYLTEDGHCFVIDKFAKTITKVSTQEGLSKLPEKSESGAVFFSKESYKEADHPQSN